MGLFGFFLQIYVHDTDEDVEYPFAVDATLRSARRFASATACDVADKGMLGQALFSFPPQPTSLRFFSIKHEHLEVCAHRIKSETDTLNLNELLPSSIRVIL